MTVQEFKELIRLKVLDEQDILLSSVGGKLQAIALSTITYPIASLQQATGIDIPDPTTGEILNINLQNSNKPYRRVDTEVIQDYYVYSIFPIIEQESIIETNTGSYSGTVVVETIKPSEVVDTQVYNALAAEAVLGSTSRTRQVVDRSSQGEIRNLTSILADSATPAEVPDSNYSKLNWTTPRYEGSKVTTTTNGGIEPMQAGAFFQGASFSRETPDSSIELQSNNNVITYNSYFSSGKLETPDYALEDLNLQLTNVAVQIGAKSINVETYQSYDITPTQLYPGDLIIFEPPSGPTYQEIIQIKPSPAGTSEQISPYINFSQGSTKASGSLGIIRNFYTNMNTIEVIAANSRLKKIQPTKLYSIVSTKLLTMTNKKVLIRDTGKILHTDNYGLVYSASFTI